MQLIQRITSVVRSQTALLLALWVGGVLLAAQLVLLLPSLKSNATQLMSAASEREQLELNRWLGDNPRQRLDQIPLGASVLGIALVDTAGKPLAQLGDAPQSVPATLDVPERRGNQAVVMWPLQSLGAEIRAVAQLDVSHISSNNRLLVLRQGGLALLTSLLGGLVTFAAAYWIYVRPTSRLLLLLRSSRESAVGNIPEQVEFGDNHDLEKVAQEFNGLIDAQRKAARQVKVKQQYLEYAAHHDPLTHLSNRLMFEDRLKQTVADSLSENRQFAIYLVDLDNFKFFNDQYGHLIGDKMVVEVGTRLKAMMRDIDLVARLDGDEFVVIQKDVEDKANAESICKRLMDLLSASFEYRGFTLKVSVSVGVAHFPDDVKLQQNDELLGEEIVNNAAVALQEAKSSGKNQYQLFNESMRSRLTARIRLEQDLKTALAEDQFEVFYQPKINIATRQVTGAEALVRWVHPEKGRISPEVFIPVAEEAGLIIDLGEWILRTACRQTRMLHQVGFEGLNIAVNISAVQFSDGGLLPMVAKALQDSSLKPEMLELEITESAVMHDPEEVILSLHELSRFGMSLAIDDFGTGYSSLAYLKRFPVDTLKIDRAFITDISKDNDDVAIVEAVLGLGNHFNMKVVAEGVEDESQLQFLRSQGCDLAQGYFISKPMNVQDYVTWLENWPYGVHGSSKGRVPAPELKLVRKQRLQR